MSISANIIKGVFKKTKKAFENKYKKLGINWLHVRRLKNLPDKDLAYFTEGTEHFDDYVNAVGWAQEFALYNRKLMMEQVIDAVSESGEVPPFKAELQVVNCHHNYVSRETHYGEEVLVIRAGFTDFGNMQKALEDKGITPISAELEWIPSTTVPVTDAQAEDVSKLIERLEQDDDVQKVFHNMG